MIKTVPKQKKHVIQRQSRRLVAIKIEFNKMAHPLQGQTARKIGQRLLQGELETKSMLEVGKYMHVIKLNPDLVL